MSPRNDVLTQHRWLRDVTAADGGVVPEFAAGAKVKGGITETASTGRQLPPRSEGGRTSAELILRYKVPVGQLDEFTYRGQRYRIVSMAYDRSRERARRLVLERKLPIGLIEDGQVIRKTVTRNEYNESAVSEAVHAVPLVRYSSTGADRELVDARVRVDDVATFYIQTYLNLQADTDEVGYHGDRYAIRMTQAWRGVAKVIGVVKR